MRQIKKSDKYKGVKLVSNNGKNVWMASGYTKGLSWMKMFDDDSVESERKAAKLYDIKQIEKGKDPVNILKIYHKKN